VALALTWKPIPRQNKKLTLINEVTNIVNLALLIVITMTQKYSCVYTQGWCNWAQPKKRGL